MKNTFIFVCALLLLIHLPSMSLALKPSTVDYMITGDAPGVSIRDSISKSVRKVNEIWNNTLFGSKLLNRILLLMMVLVFLLAVSWFFVIILALFRGISFIIDSIVNLLRWTTSALLSIKKISDKMTSKGDKGETVEEIENTLNKLLEEKKEIEDMIKATRKKFHQRKLDEESFREIIRDHQSTLIMIETKINGIEDRIKKLEKYESGKSKKT